MPSIILPRRFNRQPGGPTRLNPKYDRPGNTVLWTPVNSGINLARGNAGVISDAANWTQSVGVGGVSRVPASSTASIYFPTTSVGSGSISGPTSLRTLAITFQINTQAATKGLMQWAETTVSSGTPKIILQMNSADLRMYVGGGYINTDTGAAVVGKVQTVVMRQNGLNLTYYNAGRVLTAAVGDVNRNGSNIWFGNGYDGSAAAHIYQGYWLEDDLGDGFARELSLNPWMLHQKNPRILYFDVPAAGGAFKPAWARNSNVIIGGAP